MKPCGSALFIRMSRTEFADVFGCASSSRATAPTVCGVAIDVPLRT